MLYEFMKGYGGVLDSQESVMLAVMLPFTKYTVDEANAVRKTIARIFLAFQKVISKIIREQNR